MELNIKDYQQLSLLSLLSILFGFFMGKSAFNRQYMTPNAILKNQRSKGLGSMNTHINTPNSRFTPWCTPAVFQEWKITNLSPMSLLPTLKRAVF